MQSIRRIFVIFAFAILAACPAAQADTLEVVGQSDLGGAGLNGQVAVAGDIAAVASGILGGAGARSGYYVTYSCPAGTVKIVDISTPSAPDVLSQIPIEINAIASDVSMLDVDTPSFTGRLLAVALVRCSNTTAGNATERGTAYYDLTDPENPAFLGRFNPDENFFLLTDPPCSLANTTRCASSNDNVSLVQRANGTVLSLSTEPFSSNSQPGIIVPGCQGAGTGTGCSYRGDVRIVDVTNPATPTYVGSYPNAALLNGGVEQRPAGYNPGSFSTSNNGCRNFNAALSVGVQNGNRALVPYLDAGLLDGRHHEPGRAVDARALGVPDDPNDRGQRGLRGLRHGRRARPRAHRRERLDRPAVEPADRQRNRRGVEVRLRGVVHAVRSAGHRTGLPQAGR